MRRSTFILAIAALTLFLGLGSAASAQTASTLPGIPAGQGGPDNQVNPSQGGNAPGGQNNPAVNAGPATSTEDDNSLAPWLIGAAVLVLLAVVAAVVLRQLGRGRDAGYASGRTTV